jgi:chromosome segregation ATPase
MQVQSKHRIALALAICTIVGLVSIGASGQNRRRRRSRRHRPAATAPAGDASLTNPSEPTVVSTSDTSAGKNASSANSTGAGPQRVVDSDEAHMRRTITNLSGQVSQLTDKLTRMEEQQRALVDMERLSRAEQRAESLRAQLRGVEAQQGDLQARAEQVDYEIQPENIERALAPFGTTHPEDAREARRKQLESERGRIRAQLETLTASRTHLESDIATADAEVNRLRTRLDAAMAADAAQTPTTPADTTTNTSVPAPATNPPNSVPPNQ